MPLCTRRHCLFNQHRADAPLTSQEGLTTRWLQVPEFQPRSTMPAPK
jgi:hypothetical protein